MILTKDKSFYKTIVKIAIPIGLQNLITFSVNMADTIMLGRLGEISLSSSAIANHLFFNMMVLMFGIGGGASVMASQYYGKKDTNSIHKIMSITYRFSSILAIVFMIIAIFLPKQYMSLFTNDNIVINEGSSYLRGVSFSYIFYCLTSCSISILRSVKTVKISLLVYSISLVVNIFFNWVLIFGKFGFPTMGILGAAIATILSRLTEFIVIVIYILYFDKKIRFKLKYLIGIDKKILNSFVKTCTPIFLNELFWSIGASMISIIVSRMGTTVVAANSINNVVNQFATLFINGLASASSVITGNTIGKGEYKKAQEYAKSIFILSLFMGVISGITIYFVRDIAVNFYNVSYETKNIAREIMIATALVSVFRAVASNLMMGVLRGGGDNKFVFKVEMFFMWFISIPLGFIGAFVFKLPIVLVFLMIRSDEVLKCIAGVIRVFRGKWIKDVTK
ncbi:MAG: MATE family efflux transporter [Peptostreptococcaceae bacterium]